MSGLFKQSLDFSSISIFSASDINIEGTHSVQGMNLMSLRLRLMIDFDGYATKC